MKKRTVHAGKAVLHATEYAQTSSSGTAVTVIFPTHTSAVVPACGTKARTRRARKTDAVTCGNCKRTRAYKRKPKDRRKRAGTKGVTP